MDNEGALKPWNCLVVGVGGQGVVLASRLVAAACMDGGAFVRTAETIGMSQRGGSVASHVRVAASPDDVPSSLIGAAGADLVLSFEPGEAVRSFSQLKTTGSVVCADRAVVPAAAPGYTGSAQLDWLRAHVPPERIAVVDASALDEAGLSPKCLNVMLLGAALGLHALPFDSTRLTVAMEGLMRPKLIPMNVKALELGMKLASRR